MCAWYLLSGSVRLRRCTDVDAILDELRDLRGDEFEVVVTDVGPGAIELKFLGGSEFTDEGADELDGTLWSLGPHALEPAVFTGEYDGELRVVPIDPARNVFPAPDGSGCPCLLSTASTDHSSQPPTLVPCAGEPGSSGW